jgi:pyruvate dehydrogenase E2 component (dihydrolipoamide acetyltransferase)
MPEVVMPRLSDSMEEGTIVRWLKRDGDRVSQGEPLAEVETDKATVTFDADADGTLRILVGEGETVPIGGLIARIGEAVELRSVPSRDGADRVNALPLGADRVDAPPLGADRVDALPLGADRVNALPLGADRVDAPPLGADRVNASPPGADRVKASPLARRMAREVGIDLSGIAGTGPGGRIVKADLVAAAERAPAPPAQPEATPAEPAMPARGNKGAVTVQQPSRTQVQIAQRMSESKATIPDFTLEAEVDMDQAVMMRAQLREAARSGDVVPSYNDMVVKACALALREHPRANGAYRDGAFELYERVNVGIAVAANDSLVVPTVFDADRKSLVQIAHEARTLARRVRERMITPAELSGGTFTVSNLGMYGVRSFAAIVNPPQAAILAVGELRELPVVRGGQVEPGSRMSIVLTCDHRILYGAPAAEFLARVRQLLEQPINLLV